jgi:hypothetical protein
MIGMQVQLEFPKRNVGMSLEWQLHHVEAVPGWAERNDPSAWGRPVANSAEAQKLKELLAGAEREAIGGLAMMSVCTCSSRWKRMAIPLGMD